MGRGKNFRRRDCGFFGFAREAERGKTMKKCIIYCFSGTGNTYCVSRMLATELSPYGYDSEIFSVTYGAYAERNFPCPDGYDLIGLAYPIHAFNTPGLFRKFVKALPRAKSGQQAFVIKVSGEPFSVNNSSSAAIKRNLRKKGYRFTYEKHFLMPYNIMFRYPDGLSKQMYLYSREMAKASAKKIFSGERESVHGTPLSLITCFLGKIEWFGARFNGLFYRVDKRKCIDCGSCAKNCHTQNITRKEDGVYRFGNRCTLCCRCTMNCPRDAISMGLLNRLRVNGPYDFEALEKDEDVGGNFVNGMTVGYYRAFNGYYDKIDEELISCGLVPPRSLFPPDEYALMSGKRKRAVRRRQRAGKNRLSDTDSGQE
ncbi:MAG: EFR1 family ferrodoxin [Christensenellales bacterium]